MERTTFEHVPCPIARTLDMLGDWWAPLILRECLYGVHRFDQFQRWLGISRNILTRRLEKLVEDGLLERRPYQTNPVRHEYHLTEKGQAAAPLLLAMTAFGNEWIFGEGHEPVRVYSRKTGREVKPVLVDAETGERIDPSDLYAGPGPSFPKSEEIRRERFVSFYRGLDAAAADRRGTRSAKSSSHAKGR